MRRIVVWLAVLGVTSVLVGFSMLFALAVFADSLEDEERLEYRRRRA